MSLFKTSRGEEPGHHPSKRGPTRNAWRLPAREWNRILSPARQPVSSPSSKILPGGTGDLPGKRGLPSAISPLVQLFQTITGQMTESLGRHHRLVGEQLHNYFICRPGDTVGDQAFAYSLRDLQLARRWGFLPDAPCEFQCHFFCDCAQPC